MDHHDTGLLLGKNTPVVDEYSPDLLYPIPRSSGRQAIGAHGDTTFYGADLWHAYEISWLNSQGVPQVRVGRFFIPASSPNLVESKSFKLYLNSLNSTRFTSEEQARQRMLADISNAAGEQVRLELLPVDAPALGGAALDGTCIDDEPLTVVEQQPEASILRTGRGHAEEVLYSHLLRSLCPVTGQPDWATIWIRYGGPQLDRSALLQYIIAFRRHQEFHEQCVERMFVDLLTTCGLEYLDVQAFYTRRGGLDINPFRSTDPARKPLQRLNRQ